MGSAITEAHPASEQRIMPLDARVYVAGHRGLVGSALCRALDREGYNDVLKRTHAELNLIDTAAVDAFFEQEQPEYVILAAAKVGGILANNTYPADFIRDNLHIQMNVIEAARRTGVKRLLFLGSSCIYPKMAPQPIQEDALLTGTLEPTNRPYALAKIAGIEMCWSYNRQYGTRYLAAMPTNLYGEDDNFDLTSSHVLPALMRKAAEAKAQGEKELKVWGSGTPRREFLHADDLAKACLFLLNLPEERYGRFLNEEDAPLVNVGTGEDVTIRELAEMVKRVTGFDGELVFDASKPDGTPRKVMDIGRMHELGWHHSIELEDGIRQVFEAVKHRFAL
jgi:GDP-L-fucose synthase